ncbi:MAG: hypothetical protein H0W65_12015, partial [Sphingomonas sp.]|uniref:beta strand repeat-containing protein n=1 Tax=Sphingomonas sp. TaxID=28214 RepID=UPI0017F251C7
MPKRSALLISCASLALATALLAPQQARASAAPQGAFQGTISSSSNASQTALGHGTETITVTGSSATINWNARSNVFLPVGNTATFTSSSGLTDYTVLNRVVPIDPLAPIQLNGHVISTLEGSSTIGGNIWFYSPSGIVVGSKAVFDVGGLLLTSLSPTLNSNSATGFNASFSKQTGDGGTIQILTGAQINAVQKNSYIALVAPRIEQGGNVRVNGSTAYVAGEDVSMTMDQGLFDIRVYTGTDDPNGIVHTGTTTGVANETLDGKNRMYFMAVPKNLAITMLVGGTIGYDATTANVVNGEVVLSAGILEINDISNPPFNAIQNSNSNVLIDNAHFLSNTTVYAEQLASVNASAGDVTFDGSLFMESYYGDVSMIADGRTITLNGSANLTTSPVDFAPFLNYDSYYVPAADRLAGDITVEAKNGGMINAQSLSLDATAKGQDSYFSGGNGGMGTGGSILISANTGGSITTGSVYADASGFGGNLKYDYTTAGNGVGGSVSMDAVGGSITVNGNADLYADGSGGTFNGDGTASSYTGGNGTGGSVGVTAGTNGIISIAGTSNLSADGSGGYGANGGYGTGGSTSVYANGGSLIFGGPLYAYSNGIGGSGLNYGGFGYGGSSSATADIGGSIDISGEVFVAALALGGDGGFSGGDATGGTATIRGDGGTIHSDGQMVLTTQANGGQGTCDCSYGGSAYGGVNLIDVKNGGSVSTDGFLNFNGAAFGGNGVREGGNAYAGSSIITIDNGSVSADTLGQYANAWGGAGANGGNARGGVVTMEILAGGGTVNITGIAGLEAGGFAGAGTVGYESNGESSVGNGGYGVGGSVNLTIDGGGSVTTGDLELSADGIGGDGGNSTTPGNGGSGGNGGYGQGGNATISVISGSLTAANIQSRVNGLGGFGGAAATGSNGNGGTGGGAQGGTDIFNIGSGGTVNATTYAGYGRAFGGDGGAGVGTGNAGDGGAAVGGVSSATIDGTGTFGGSVTGEVDTGFVLTSFARSGDGQTSNSASGGTATIDINGTLTTTGLVEAAAQAIGGAGLLAGGNAFGGTATINVYGDLTAATLFVAARGFGGSGGDVGGLGNGGFATFEVDGGTAMISTAGLVTVDGVGGAATNPGGTGGDGSAGLAQVSANIGGTATLNDLSVLADGTGGAGDVLGSGFGNEAYILADDSVINLTGTTTVSASGSGQDSRGGSANIYAQYGATINGQTVNILANASGPGGNGGNAGLSTYGATVDIADATIQANGSANGGHAELYSTGIFANGLLTNGSLTTGALTMSANGGTSGGSVLVHVDNGSSANLGIATLTATGSGADISVIAGASSSTASLPAIFNAQSLSIISDGSISLRTYAGSDINVSGDLTATGGTISLVDDGLGGQIMADNLNLTGSDISGNGNLSATNVTLASTGNIDLSGTIVASNDVNLTAAGFTAVHDVNALTAEFTAGSTANFYGTVSAPTITVTSNDLNVVSGAFLGVFGITNLLTLNSTNADGLYVGMQPDVFTGYGLDEQGELQAANIVVNSLPGCVECIAPNIFLGTFSIDGTDGSNAGVSSVTFNTTGSILVGGLVNYFNAAATDSLTLNAGQNIEINTDSGGISMTNAVMALSGQLALNANNIWVASGLILGELEVDPNYVGRATDLASNSGTSNPDGFVKAGSVNAGIGSTFFVQNSGLTTDMGGITVGDGGLTLNSTGTGPAAVDIYGRQIASNGTTTTGDAFVGTVQAGGPGGYTSDSTINDCPLAGCA